MAAPAQKTLKDLNGQWVMNKSLSDDFDTILALQGVSWFIRKAISYATITLTITQYTSPSTSSTTTSSPTTHIDISQTVTGGIKGTTEKRTLDWTLRPHSDGVFGDVQGKSRWVKVKDLEEGEDKKFLSEGWLEGGDDGEEHVESWVESVGGGWVAEQIWGFEKVDGERYYVRHVVVRKGDEVRKARLVYDFVQ